MTFSLTVNQNAINVCVYIYIYMGKGAKIATVISQMDNFDTRNFDGAKLDIINQNGTILSTPLS